MAKRRRVAVDRVDRSAALPLELWERVAGNLDDADVARLAATDRTRHAHLGVTSNPAFWIRRAQTSTDVLIGLLAAAPALYCPHIVPLLAAQLDMESAVVIDIYKRVARIVATLIERNAMAGALCVVRNAETVCGAWLEAHRPDDEAEEDDEEAFDMGLVDMQEIINTALGYVATAARANLISLLDAMDPVEIRTLFASALPDLVFYRYPVAVIVRLLEAGVSAGVDDVMAYAIRITNLELAARCIQAGANIQAHGSYCLANACELYPNEQRDAMVRLLLGAGASATQVLQQLARENLWGDGGVPRQQLARLVALGLNVNAGDGEAIRLALQIDDAAVAQVVEAGAAPNLVLFPAAQLGHTQWVEWALNAGADAAANQSLALRMAVAERRDIELIDLLLRAGADVHARGEEPLRAAVSNYAAAVSWVSDEALQSHVRVIERLLAAGANPATALRALEAQPPPPPPPQVQHLLANLRDGRSLTFEEPNM